MQQNQLYVIQVNTMNNKGGPLALPAPAGALLPSEVKYSASLVRGLGCSHLVLGAVLFLLGVLGSWVEPETCWAGAGIWGGISTIACGICGLLAYHLWYKNYTIKAFLVTSVVCVVISILSIVLTIYGLVNRYEHYYYLIERAEKHPWFRPYNQNQEQQLTLSVSANQLVGFILEFILAVWSVKIGWKGVRAEEFSSSRRDALCDDLQSVVSVPHHNGQVPLAALYQLLQAHPELLGSKNLNGSLGHPWVPGLDDRTSQQAMDYQERVSRFLSHAIEDHNGSFSRSPSVFQGEIQENSPLTRPASVAGGSEGRGSLSRGSADTLVISPHPSNEGHQRAPHEDLREKKVAGGELSQTDTMKSKAKLQATKQKSEGELKGKAPNPKDSKQSKGKEKVVKKKENLENQITEEQVESSISVCKESNEDAIPEKSTKDMKDYEKSSTEETKAIAVSQPEDLQITAESSHHRRPKVLVEGNAENETCKSENKSKSTKKRRSTSKERKEEAPSPSPSPPKTEKEEKKPKTEKEEKKPKTEKEEKKTKTEKEEKKTKTEIEEKNRQGTIMTSPEDEKIGSNAVKVSNRKTNESKDKREERIMSAENTEERQSHKGEKRKSSKKDVLTVNEEDKTNDTRKKEQKESTKNATETSDTKEDARPKEDIRVETDTNVNADSTSATSNIPQNDKAKKSKKSKRDKESKGKSRKHKEVTKSSIIPEENVKDATGISDASNTNGKVTKLTDDSKLVKDTQQSLVIDLKPPSEFQDSSVNSTAS